METVPDSCTATGFRKKLSESSFTLSSALFISLQQNTPKINMMVTRAHFFCLVALTFILALAADDSPL